MVCGLHTLIKMRKIKPVVIASTRVKECLGGDIMGQSNQCTMGAYSKLSQ
jgi:hypothetical protein